ncbi:MAG: peptide-methionine (S)-S-oxide reductase MsrA [Gammaproteobacteria bacterium]|nr:peptide-methionine (S)-S-oxide reductase MsrA [Gammaproteobacteria bacterium]MDH3767231.1 peptide-methionine (S)-S-oxide reductase MsrA [Gammaproteobacteria bacterium]
MTIATFGAGCFWGVEAAFRELDIIDAAVGYMGGTLDNPSYEDVCTGQSGHVEVVQIEFDPTITSYDQLLAKFWSCHNPTQHNRQGPDRGSQYRSVIFYHDEAQRETAEASKKSLDDSKELSAPIATRIEAATVFWRGEDYHQRYLEKRGQAHCRL